MFKRKILFVLGFIFLVALVFNINNVKAIDENYVQNLIDKFPDEIKLDIEQVDYQNAPYYIIKYIESIFNDDEKISFFDENNNRSTSKVYLKDEELGLCNILIQVSKISDIMLMDNKIHDFRISVLPIEGAAYMQYLKVKNIKVEYRNDGRNNFEDEEYVKNLKIDNTNYYEVDLDFTKNQNKDKFCDVIEEYYNNLVDDKTITIKTEFSGGTNGRFNLKTDEVNIGLFKNGILYDARTMGIGMTMPVIKVSDNITENELKDCLSEILKNTNSNFKENIEITSIEEGIENYAIDVPDGYTIKYKVKYEGVSIEDNYTAYAIIRREKITKDYLREILNEIPEIIELGIPNSGYEQVIDLIRAKVEEILDKKIILYNSIYNIVDLKNIKNEEELDIGICIYFLEPNQFNFKKAKVAFYYKNNNERIKNEDLQKEIELIYDNTNVDNYDLDDEKYIQNLKIKLPEYLEYNIDDVEFQNVSNQYNTQINLFPILMSNYFRKILNDESIYIECVPRAGNMNYINNFEYVDVKILKNNNIYNVLSIGTVSIPVIIVSSEVEDTKMISYALEKIKVKFKDNGEYDVEKMSIDKGIDGKVLDYYEVQEIEDGYKLLYDNNDEYRMRIIIRKESKLDDDIEEILDKMIYVLPDTINLEREIDFDTLEEEIIKIWQNNEINLENLNKFSVKSPLYLTKEDFYKCGVYIEDKFNNSRYKTIIVNYNNSKDYNIEDEQYIKSIELESPKYYEVNLDFLLADNLQKNFMKMIEEYYTKQINDESIIVKVDAGAGFNGFNSITFERGTSLGIFKDGILYEIRSIGNEISIPVIIIPKEINEENIEDYIKQKINEYKPEMIVNDMKKGTKGFSYLEIDIQDGYTINYEVKEAGDYSYEYEGIIIVKRIKDIEKQDKVTNIKLNTDTTIVPENTIIVVQEVNDGGITNSIKEGIIIKSKVYDIKLMLNEEEIQPNGKVKISIPIPDGFDTNKIEVYRIEDDGTRTEYEITIEGDYIVFETDHFSNYAIIEKSEYELGDVNKDGKINALDATLILKYVAKKKDLTEEQLKLADVTKDGKVNALDAVKILKYVAKKITEF